MTRCEINTATSTGTVLLDRVPMVGEFIVTNPNASPPERRYVRVARVIHCNQKGTDGVFAAWLDVEEVSKEQIQ